MLLAGCDSCLADAQVFEIDEGKSWRAVAVTLPAVALGYAAIAVAPWYLLPAVYVYLSAAVTGLFVIGHDAGAPTHGPFVHVCQDRPSAEARL